MATRVLLTVDTEMTWRPFARGADWRDNLALSFDPAGVGLPYQLAILRRHGLKACFFVDPMPALLYGLEPIKRMIAPILEAGQDVQLHLHSFWSDLAAGARETARFELTDFDPAAQHDLIATARDLLIAAGGSAPIAFRSGSYAADRATLQALAALGIPYDSSHNGAEHPWPSALPFDPAQIDPIQCAGVTEIPISLIRGRGGRLRPLQLCALSDKEMRAALHHAADNRHPLVTIVSHSFELATRDGRRVNRTVRRRFDSLCGFLACHETAMPTTKFADLGALPRSAASQPMAARPLRTAERIAQQLWSDACYERPVTAAIALGGPTLVALEYLARYAA